MTKKKQAAKKKAAARPKKLGPHEKAKSTRKRTKKIKAPEWPMVYETFNTPRPNQAIYLSKDPSCFNGSVDVVRYRVSVVPIVEPEEIKARIQKLWRECNNYHHWGPLKAAAEEHGVELKTEDRGVDAKKDKWGY